MFNYKLKEKEHGVYMQEVVRKGTRKKLKAFFKSFSEGAIHFICCKRHISLKLTAHSYIVGGLFGGIKRAVMYVVI